MIRRAVAGAIAALLAVVLAACTGLPTSGPVYPGQAAEETTAGSDTIFLPDRPQPGADPEAIVEGFIRAGSGPTDSWSRAREFLSAGFASEWRPTAGVTVVLPGDRVYETVGEDAVTLSVVAVAGVDERGAYEPVDAGTITLSFQLVQEDGEWRISEAPDGIVLDSDQFPSVYHRYEVFYFDPTWTYLVPDARWFPTTNAPTRIADALVNRPMGEWLTDAVVTSFPEEVSVNAAVPVDSGVAQVELRDALGVDRATLDRMLTQLQASLATAGVSRVEMSVSQAPLGAETVSTRSTRVAGTPLVLTEDGFGFLSADELTPVDGLSDVIPGASPTAIQVGPDRLYAVLKLPDGSVHRVTADGEDAAIDARAGLIDPSIDPFGAAWSVPRSHPSELVAVMPDGTRAEVADAFPGATGVSAMSVSRDGTRIAAAVTVGARSELWVAGIVRDADGVPLRLGTPLLLGSIDGTGGGVAWLDDVTVGAISTADDGGAVYEQLVGGPPSTTSAPVAVASIAGGTTVSSVRLRTDDGTLLVRRGSNWQEAATGVLVLATQQGTPE